MTTHGNQDSLAHFTNRLNYLKCGKVFQDILEIIQLGPLVTTTKTTMILVK